jgi:hypothetical protein
LAFRDCRNRSWKPVLALAIGHRQRCSRSGHLAPTFADSDLTPFAKFPVNDYEVDDPEMDFEKLTLTVAGSVQRPGDYADRTMFLSTPSVWAPILKPTSIFFRQEKTGRTSVSFRDNPELHAGTEPSIRPFRS